LNAYLDPLRNCTRFEGRSVPSRFWVFALVNFVALNVLFQLDVALGWMFAGGGFGGLSTAFGFAMLLPTVAAAVRRLHDGGSDGVIVAIGVVPIIGWIVLFFMLARSSQRGPNRFGPDPTGWVPAVPSADGGIPSASRGKGTLVACPWCGRSNPQGRDSCQWCHKRYLDPVGSHV